MMRFNRSEENDLRQQALPLEDEEDDENNECYQYLRGVRDEAIILDQQWEDQKQPDGKYSFIYNTSFETHYSLTNLVCIVMEFESDIKPMKVIPLKSKGTGILNVDEKWKNETLQHYKEMQTVLHLRRDEFKEHYPEYLYQYDHDIENIILRQDTDDGEEQKEEQSRFKYPDTDEIAKCSEGFLHYSIRNILDLYEEEWKSNFSIPQELQLWIWSFLIMIQKPLIPDLAADLNDLLSALETIKEHLSNQIKEGSDQGYTMYDSIILVITEEFGQRFAY